MRRDFVIADGFRGPGPLPRLQRRRARHRPGRLVRRGRGEGLPRRRRPTLPTICGTGPRGLRRQRVGHGRAHARPTAARRSIVGPDSEPEPRLRRLLPLARPRPDHVRARPARDDPADRRDVLPRRARRQQLAAYEKTNPVAGEGWIPRRRRPACSRGASPSASTTTARPRSSTAASRSRCPGSTSPPRSPTSSARTTRSPSRKSSSPPPSTPPRNAQRTCVTQLPIR